MNTSALNHRPTLTDGPKQQLVTTTFAQWLKPLLQHLHLPHTAPISAVATFHFSDTPDIHITSTGEQIDMLSQAGVLAVPYNTDTLLALLALNRCHGAADAVSVVVEKQSGTVIVWSRQRQSALDVEATTRLMRGVQEKTRAVRKLLDTPTAKSNGRSSAAMLTRMLHQNQEPAQ